MIRQASSIARLGARSQQWSRDQLAEKFDADLTLNSEFRTISRAIWAPAVYVYGKRQNQRRLANSMSLLALNLRDANLP